MRRIIVMLINLLSIPKKMLNHISPFSIIQKAKIDKTSAISSGVKFYRGNLGKYSYIGNNSFVADTDIGNFTSISSDCYIGGASHPINWVSTSPVFHKWGNIMKKNFSKHEFQIFHKTKIGNDVWIGNKVLIKAGVTIGDGAIIGMGSVVTKDIGPYEIWAGNPARIIRKRFDDDTISFLLNYAWWELDEKRIEEDAKYFNDIEILKKRKERL